MIYPSIDKLLNIVDSKYQLVHIAANRSKEMAKNNHYQLPTYVSQKNIGKALEEIAENLIIIKND
ncbi:MAG: DNA-directed RNA polymerase subunit omega [Tenericutes bacterium]|nr:DNA-directed RNA polymerase subunit omega [Mycoplasmatota bacterium]